MRVDAHQHFWDVDAPWLSPDAGTLYQKFGPEDLAFELQRAGVDLTVLVQSDDSPEDTASMLAQSDAHHFVAGVVGWVPLVDVDACATALDALGEHPRFCGVRHLIHLLPDPDWLLQPSVLDSLRLLADRNLTFDVVSILPRHLENVARIATHVPNLKVVIDHLSKPPIADQGWQPWADLLAMAAEYPNVYAKVSGLNTAARPGWTAADLEPYVAHAVEQFGVTRLMFGSDWPVCTLVDDYQRVWTGMHDLLDRLRLGAAERDAVLGATAIDFYRLQAVADG